MFITALFMIVKLKKPLKCHQEMDKEDVYTYSGILLSCKE